MTDVERGARADWEARIGRRSDAEGGLELPLLDAPADLQAIGSRSDDGRIAILAWNGTVDVSKAGGDPLLHRSASLHVRGLSANRYRLHHRRLDEEHSNLVASWARIGRGADWPNAGQWDELAARDMLQALGPVREVRSSGGRLELELEPMPSVSLLELSSA